MAGIFIFFSLLSFSDNKIRTATTKEIHIDLTPHHLKFLSEEDIQNEAISPYSKNGKILFSEIIRIYRKLNENPWLCESVIYSPDGKTVQIECRQRTPLIRFQNHQGEHFYIDSLGHFIPTRKTFAVEVPFASGYIFETFTRHASYSIPQIQSNTSLRKVFRSSWLWDTYRYLQSDTLLSRMIQNIYIDKQGNILLIPSVGKHRVVLGKPDRIDEKLKKLSIFYKEGYSRIPHAGEYDLIQLQFKNQVVCSMKKTKNS